MKKKLEAELISIAHRILKLKNRAELDQLQQETLKLYEKISVLRFVEDNFNEVKPTIGFASAEEKLEDIYGIEEVAPVHANEQEAKEEERKAISQKLKAEEQLSAVSSQPSEREDKENDKGEGVDTTGGEEAPASDVEKEETAENEEVAQTETEDTKAAETTETPASAKEADHETDNIEQNAAAEEEEEVAEGGPASEEEVRYTQEETDETVEEAPAEEAPKAEEKPKEEPKQVPLFDIEVRTDEPKKQKEITFEDYHDYKEPEFVKKEEVKEPQNINREFLPKEPEVIQKQEDNAAALSDEQPVKEEAPVRDWRDWEPSTSPYASRKEEPKAEEPKAQAQAVTPNMEPVMPNTQLVQPAASAPQGSNGRTITLGLNDRIAFEKNLFGGSGEDLNRVISQLNTFNTFADARNFINDLVKPDYNNWKGKEEYEERLMELVEKRFS